MAQPSACDLYGSLFDLTRELAWPCPKDASPTWRAHARTCLVLTTDGRLVGLVKDVGDDKITLAFAGRTTRELDAYLTGGQPAEKQPPLGFSEWPAGVPVYAVVGAKQGATQRAFVALRGKYDIPAGEEATEFLAYYEARQATFFRLPVFVAVDGRAVGCCGYVHDIQCERTDAGGVHVTYAVKREALAGTAGSYTIAVRLIRFVQRTLIRDKWEHDVAVLLHFSTPHPLWTQPPDWAHDILSARPRERIVQASVQS